MPIKAPPQVLTYDSVTVLREELAAVRDKLAVPETEETWDEIGMALMRLGALASGNASYGGPEIITHVRSLSRPLTSALNSERTRLSGIAVDLITTLSAALGTSFEPLIPLFVPTLLGLCTRTNKVFLSRARACILTVIEHTHSPALLPLLAESTKDKSTSLRLSAAESILACLNTFQLTVLDKEPRIAMIESVIRTTAKDASADVRKVARRIFEAYQVLFPRRIEKFAEPLTPTIKKYLSIKVSAAPQSRPHSSQSTYSDREMVKPSTSRSLVEALQAGPSRPAVHSLTSHNPSVSTNAIPNTDARIKSSRSAGPVRVPSVRGPATESQRPGRHQTDMGPPKDIPGKPTVVRATRKTATSTRPEAQGQPTQSQQAMKTSVATSLTQSSSSRPGSRPGSTTAEMTSDHERQTERPGSSHPASRPLRPATEELHSSSSRQDHPDKAGRVVGGARRVRLVQGQDGTSRSQVHDVQAQNLERPKGASENERAASPGINDDRPDSEADKPPEPAVNKNGKAQESRRSQPPTQKPQARPVPRKEASVTGRHGPSIATGSRGRIAKKARTVNLPRRTPITDTQLAAAIPLPASRGGSPDPALIPLPPSPKPLAARADPTTPRNTQCGPFASVEQTPISALVASIQQGFLFTPSPNATLPHSALLPQADEEDEYEPIFATTIGLRIKANDTTPPAGNRDGIA